jgi:hypothetical protein
MLQQNKGNKLIKRKAYTVFNPREPRATVERSAQVWRTIHLH